MSQLDRDMVELAVPEPPIANSLHDILHKDGSYTYDNTTDSLEAISDAVATVENLTDKEKSLLSIGVYPGLQDFFNTVANDASPDTTYWSVATDNGTTDVLTDTEDEPGYLLVGSGVGAGRYAVVQTADKYVISLKQGVTTIHFKSYCKLDYDSDGECSIGLIENDLAGVTGNQFILPANNPCGVVVDNGTPKAVSSDGTTNETTDLSSWISDDTWFLLEVRLTDSSVAFYIDGTLRATHSTRVPSSVFQVWIGANYEGSAEKLTYAQYIQVWGE